MMVSAVASATNAPVISSIAMMELRRCMCDDLVTDFQS